MNDKIGRNRTESGRLSPIQERALNFLLNGKSISDTANEIKVSRSTVHEWLKHPFFLSEYNRRLAEMKADLKNMTIGLYSEAFQTLRACLQEKHNRKVGFEVAKFIIERLERLSIGATDPRKIIEKDCTRSVFDDLSGLGRLDQEKYVEQCKIHGLEP